MTNQTNNQTSTGRRRLLPIGALAALLALLVGLVAAAHAAGQGSAETPELGSLEQQVEAMREARERLAEDGALEDKKGARQSAAKAPPGAGALLLQGVLQGLGKAGGESGFKGIMAALGQDRTENMLNEVTQSLDRLNAKVEAMANRMEQLFSETQFKDTHRDARTAYDVIDGHARSIAGYEKDGVEPSELQLNNIAKDSYTAVSTLRGLLTDAKTGAIPLILTSYGKDAPVSTGKEPWERVTTYREHFLAAQALAVTNLAWVAEKDASYRGSHLEPAAEMLRETNKAAHNVTGAPHPQDPTGGSYLHRVGEDWALMTAARPELAGEKGAAEGAIDKSVLEQKLQRLASGYSPIEGATLEQYMTDNGFKTVTSYHDTYGWDILVNGSGYTKTMIAWTHRGTIAGNSYENRKLEYFRQNTTARRDVMEKHLQDMTAKNQAWLRDNPQFFVAPIHTNAHGWPALTDAESIRMSRDGLEDLRISRGAGKDVEATFANPGGTYSRVQVKDLHSGEVFVDGPVPEAGVPIAPGVVETDAVVVELGHRVDGEFDSRGGSVITSNPGESTIQLDLQVG